MIEDELRRALARLLDGLPSRQAAGAVQRLIDGYRSGSDGGAPALRERADVVAYAAYRMPATFGAVSAALAGLAERTGGWSPRSHLDVGGGTGAAVWAAAGVWGAGGAEDGREDGRVDGPESGPRRTTVLDRSAAALAVGRELVDTGGEPGGDSCAVEWRRRALPPAGEAELPEADLVTVSYVLGELGEADRASVVDAAADAASGAVVLVEPGTPDGYLRIRAAREQLTGAGLRVLAPCPHSARCPIEPGSDWCHFAARVNRSSLHRRIKGGTLPYEDEKFSYVAAVPDADAIEAVPADARILRRPQRRKGQVLLDLCRAAPEELRRTTVSKRQGPVYRAARDADWGDAWSPEA